MTVGGRPLAGRRIATTRDAPGRLDRLLADLGADVVHVPLIEIVDAPDLASSLARIGDVDWIVVTSRHGAERIAGAVAARPGIRTAAVGARTAEVLAEHSGRPVAVVPDRQTADELVAAMPAPDPSARRALVAQADLAEPTLVDGLRARGYEVQVLIAYRTRLRRPTAAERRTLEDVEAVAFASGSAARAWAEAIGTWTPPHVVAIGPTTARVAGEAGLQVTAIAADHSVEGLAAEVTAALTTPT